MGRKLLIGFLAVLLAATSAEAAGRKAYKSSGFTSTAGLNKNLVFHFPFNDPDNPLRLNVGTQPVTYSRVHDATHTATFLHPTTGLVTVAASNQLRIEAYGALFEGARTNLLLWSRAMDNAAWTKTNTSAGKTITGEDGVSNSASWVAASSNGGTVKQAVTIASAAFTGSVSIKRITGTGTVKISVDGGSTYGADLAASLSTSAWYRASRTQTVANPSLTIQLGTSGDNVAVDYAGIEAGGFASSRIPTTTAAMSRNYDNLLFKTDTDTITASGTSFAEIKLLGLGAFNDVWSDVASVQPLGKSNADVVFVYDSTSLNTGGAVGLSPSRIASRWGGGKMNTAVNGVAGTEGNFDGAMVGDPTGTGLYLATNGAAESNYLWGWLRNFKLLDRAFTDAELEAITQ